MSLSIPKSVKRIGLTISALFAVYVVSYLIFSLRGRYEPQVIGLNGVKSYQWAPQGFVTDFRWNGSMGAFFLPLHLLDTGLWHTSDHAYSERYPVHQVSTSEIEPAKAKIPSFLMGEVGGERLSLRILPERSIPSEGKPKGTLFINVEPGCIMLEAYATLISGNKLEIHMPHDDAMTLRAMKQMGVSSKRIVVTFEPSESTNQAGTILAITSSENKPHEQAAPSSGDKPSN